MRLIDADRLLSDRMRSKYYNMPNGDTAIPIIDIEHAPTVGGWISVKDRLPERGEEVLVISGKYIQVFAFDVICGENAWEDIDGARWSYAEETDYWMPLPEPPEVEA